MIKHSRLGGATAIVAGVALLTPAHGHAGDREEARARDAWGGAYAGLVIGGGGAGVEVDAAAGAPGFELNEGNVSLGGLVGFNVPLGARAQGGGWLAGLELEMSSLALRRSRPVSGGGEARLDSDWLASARIRAGHAWEDVYLYATAGLALSDIDLDKSSTDGKAVKAGLALGIGAEVKLDTDWAARVEAIGYGLGREDARLGGIERDASLGAAMLRLGVTRRF